MKHTFIHDEDPARKMVPALVAALVEGGALPELRVCPQCSIRGVARALRDMLDLAAEGDRQVGSTHGAELRAECLNIVDESRPTVTAGPEDAQ